MGSSFFRQFSISFSVFQLCASLALAGTVPVQLTKNQQERDGFSLVDLLVEDQLGFTCIPEDKIESAFFATGKGIRLPRTCLPEPCTAALTEFELASLIGRTASSSEWGDYFSRYADVCRKEITPFDQDDITAISDNLADTDDTIVGFWEPLLASFVAPSVAAAGTALVSNPPRNSVFRPSFIGSRSNPVPETIVGTPGEPNNPIFTPTTEPPDHTEPEENHPLTVPLPAAIWLLFFSVVGLFSFTRRGRFTVESS